MLFCNLLDDADDAPLSYVHGVVEGVTQPLTEQSSTDRGIGYLRVGLLAIGHHAADSSRSQFANVAAQVVERCLADVELVEI